MILYPMWGMLEITFQVYENTTNISFGAFGRCVGNYIRSVLNFTTPCVLLITILPNFSSNGCDRVVFNTHIV